MYPHTLVEIVLRYPGHWFINGHLVTGIVHNRLGLTLMTADGCEYVCNLAGDDPYTIEDVRPSEAAFLGAPMLPEKILVYKRSSEPGSDRIVLVNKGSAEQNALAIAECRAWREEQAKTERKRREAAQKAHQEAYQQTRVAPLRKILMGKQVDDITLENGRFCITVGGSSIQVTADIREASGDGPYTDPSVGIRVSFGEVHVLSTHDLEEG